MHINYEKCSVDESEKLIKARELEEVPTIKKTMNYADVIYKSGEFNLNDTYKEINKFKALKDEVIKND